MVTNPAPRQPASRVRDSPAGKGVSNCRCSDVLRRRCFEIGKRDTSGERRRGVHRKGGIRYALGGVQALCDRQGAVCVMYYLRWMGTYPNKQALSILFIRAVFGLLVSVRFECPMACYYCRVYILAEPTYLAKSKRTIHRFQVRVSGCLSRRCPLSSSIPRPSLVQHALRLCTCRIHSPGSWCMQTAVPLSPYGSATAPHSRILNALTKRNLSAKNSVTRSDFPRRNMRVPSVDPRLLVVQR
jgi:hypothetical protein